MVHDEWCIVYVVWMCFSILSRYVVMGGKEGYACHSIMNMRPGMDCTKYNAHSTCKWEGLFENKKRSS